MPWYQALSLAGATLVLIAYGGSQYAGIKPDGLAYGLLNLVGSFALVATAISPLNAGVVLMETAWAILSVGIIVKALRRKAGRAAEITLEQNAPGR